MNKKMFNSFKIIISLLLIFTIVFSNISVYSPEAKENSDAKSLITEDLNKNSESEAKTFDETSEKSTDNGK